MVKVIMGLKGSGKTKKLVELVNVALTAENGNVIVLEKGKKLTYDIPYTARLIHAGEYEFGTYQFFKGFISGMYACNYDITHVFIDNFFKMFEDIDLTDISELLDWLDAFSERNGVKFTISVTADAATAGDNIRKYFL